jgi:hypothetical protein
MTRTSLAFLLLLLSILGIVSGIEPASTVTSTQAICTTTVIEPVPIITGSTRTLYTATGTTTNYISCGTCKLEVVDPLGIGPEIIFLTTTTLHEVQTVTRLSCETRATPVPQAAVLQLLARNIMGNETAEAGEGDEEKGFSCWGTTCTSSGTRITGIEMWWWFVTAWLMGAGF